jgi:hypothetical protein
VKIFILAYMLAMLALMFMLTADAQTKVFPDVFIPRTIEPIRSDIRLRGYVPPIRHIGEHEQNQMFRRNYNARRGYTQRQRQVEGIQPTVLCSPNLGGGQTCHSF